MTAVLAAAAFAVSTLAQAHEPPPSPSGTNVVVGRVLDVGNGAPVPNAVVTLIGYFDAGRPAARLPQSSISPLATAPKHAMVTGDGSFVFRNLAAGRYSLAATAFGYAPDAYPLHIVEVTDSERPLRVSLRLSKYGSISGTVVDELGEPVAGVAVTALRRHAAGDSVLFGGDSATAETDDRGAYRIAQLPAGEYAVGVLSTSTSLPAAVAATVGSAARWGDTFRDLLKAGIHPQNGDGVRAGGAVLQPLGPAPPLSPDGRLLTYQNTLAPGTQSTSAATLITLASGESRAGVDIAMHFAPAVRASGVVSGPGGFMPNVAVQLVPTNGADTIDAYTEDYNPAGIAIAASDAAGAFVFPAIAPGQYTLKALVVAEATNETPAVSLWASQPVTIGETGMSGLAVTLRPGIRVRGRLEFKGASGPVVSATYPVVLVLGPPVAAGLWRHLPSRITSGDTFATAGDPPGRYLLTVLGGSEASGWTLESVSRAGRRLDDDVIDLEAEDVPDVVVTFSKTPTRVTGTITDASGAPDPNAAVVVFPADTSLWREGVVNRRRIRATPASSAGRFELNGLAPGDYYLAAIDAALLDGWNDPAFLDRLVADATKFTLEPSAEKQLALKTPALRGR